MEAIEGRTLLSGTGLTAQYFTNTNLTGLQVVQTDPQINFSWGNSAPVAGVTAGNFSTRWEGWVEPTVTGTYTFSTTEKDGARLWVGLQEIINDWADHATAMTDTATTTIAMNAGTMYPIKMEFYNDSGNASASLSFSAVSGTTSVVAQQVIPQADLYALTTPAAAYTATTPNTAAATSSTSGLPAGWSHADIGQPSAAGSATYSNNTFTVTGGGTLIGGVNDAFQFAYQQVTGNFTLIAQLTSMSDPNNGATAGIEVRTGLTGSTREFFVGEQPSGRIYTIKRTNDGASETNSNTIAAINDYIRLQRSGDQIVASYSTDGITWSYGADISFVGGSNTVYAGLAVASRASTVCTATFANVAFSNPLSNNTTSEIGNSYVGGENHVPLFAAAAFVDPTSGQLYLTGSDEDKGLAYINSDGSFDVFGDKSHYEAGEAIGEDSNYIYDAQAGSYTTGTDGVQRYDHYGISIGNAVLGSDAVTGIAVGGGKLYIATDGLIYVYNTSNFAFSGTCFEVPRAGQMAVDPTGNLWIIQKATTGVAAQVSHYSPTGTLLGGTITFPSSTFADTVVPVGIAVDQRTGATNGQVYITDTGQLQQIDIFNADGSFSHTFGDVYGIYGGAVPGAAGPTKFNFPVGVGLDSSGDIYVVNAGAPEQWGGSATGTDDIIEKYNSAGTQLWEKYSAEVYDTMAADPANPTNVYDRFSSFTLNTPTGTNPVTSPAGTFTGTLVNPFTHPDDPRLVGTAPVSAPLAGQPALSGESPRVGSQIEEINGVKFLFDSDQHNSAINVYRFLPGTNTTVFCDSFQTETNRYYTDRSCIWVDANGDGTRQASEETFTTDAPKYATNEFVDANGNIWVGDDDTGHNILFIREFKLNATTPILPDGALNYSTTNVVQYNLPSMLTTIGRFTYDAASDSMYIAGFTTASPKPANDTNVSSGTQMLKFAGWVAGNNGTNATPSWTTNIAYDALDYHNNAHSFYVTGGYVFVQRGWEDDGLDIYDATTGNLVTTLYANANTGAGNGAETDFQNSVTAVQMPNGQYFIYAEDDLEARVLVFVWSPGESVKSFTVDNGAAQRSMVRTLSVGFTVPVTLDANAMSLTMTTAGTSTTPTSTPVTFSESTPDGGITYILTPTSSTSGGSLTDGTYSLSINPSAVHNAASPVTTMTWAIPTYTFFRLFGDSNGDGTVNLTDYRAFVATYLTSTGQAKFSSIFDANNDGTINLTDYRAFTTNYLKTITS